MSGGRRRTGQRVGGALLALVLLTGCGGGGGAGAASDAAPSTAPGVGVVTTAADGVQEITLQTQDDYVFLPAAFTVDPGTVRLTVVNVAEEMTHNLEFDEGQGPEPIDAGISLLAPGEEKTIEFTVTEPGVHPFTCTFHTQLGQVGTMTVRG
ncbi:plastocyanin/azurin family copper-binding protein [Blastococcus tunisiensis]|uniref:Plastocyanin n=1 Tax=Blastococcus tunisiensis TaxID=1798228 RepID=A0A1I1XLA2_9ACTN|nr:plastocyanin/azurin family copper-binding protein [Blastococcus sp. DSM 46838]SFE08135.1 Plastocyanin [Blastococcus sp. DSM 46838]